MGSSPIHDFELALGQYVFYQIVLKAAKDDHKLYLAISDRAHLNVFRHAMIRFILSQNPLPIIVVDVEKEEVTQWIN